MGRRKLRVLAIDDDPADLNILRRHLQRIDEWEIDFIPTGSPEEAAREWSGRKADIILLDYQLGAGTGLEVLESFFGSTKPEAQSVIMITGHGDEEIAAEAIKAGASDYIPKSRLGPMGLRLAIQRVLELCALRRQLEDQQRDLERLARQDELTGLLNRRTWTECAEREMLRSSRYGSQLSLLMLDLDQFKQVNDTHGHLAGDAVLRQTGRLFRERVRRTDLAGRIGGDEFCILMVESTTEQATVFGERLRQRLRECVIEEPNGGAFTVTCSIGVAARTEGMEEIEELIGQADQALYRAKSSGGDLVSD